MPTEADELYRQLDDIEVACDGYREALDSLLRRVESGHGTLRTLIFPIAASWYRYLQLRFKAIQLVGKLRHGELAKQSETASLSERWQLLREHITRHPSVAGNYEVALLDRHIEAISSARSDSYVSRHLDHSFGLPLHGLGDADAAQLREMSREACAVLKRVTTDLRQRLVSSARNADADVLPVGDDW